MSSSDQSSEQSSSSEVSSDTPSSSEQSSEASSEEPQEVDPVYDEAPDSLDGVDASDLSDLYSAFDTPIANYTSKTTSYFNYNALENYYRHYGRNYVPEKETLVTGNSYYTYPVNEIYGPVLNDGYADYQGNSYTFRLAGENNEERLSSKLTEGDLTLLEEGKGFRNKVFTLSDLNQSFFETYGFVRVSQNKYQFNRQFKAEIDNALFDKMAAIVSPNLINSGYFMTWSKVTIELNPMEGVAFRIRLYAYRTQIGKLVSYHENEEYPNWYLLFSEALISDVGTTTFAPGSPLLD